ncbi:hypothetical protein [Methylocystis heyeri]|uniref:DUF3617 family protein n=1 Tax=Methylocystis heyeri TaxID=391905 RepID=A0A6B8KEN9_9HYPH|nr:hypothetical protein [Methylocystis heyeri]QGM45475.1 hypothetical protein H2LOC_007075 [Methylocystis heyeri]
MIAAALRGVGVGASLLVSAASAGAAENPPLAGCYERVYDKGHLSAHKDQIVTRVRLKIRAAPEWEPQSATDPQRIVADADLRIWAHGAKKRFDSTGACWKQGEELMCNASLSAAEIDPCKSKGDGVRDCRIDASDAGSFRLSPKPEGLLLAVHKRLELPETGPDASAPFLYLSPDNPENHAFLLKRSSSCD